MSIDNIVSGVCILVLILSLARGYRVGFLRSIVRLISSTIIVALSGFLATVVGSFIVGNTQLPDKIYADIIEDYPALSIVAESLSEEIVYGIAFLIIILAIGIVLRITRAVIRIIERIPIIRGLNKALGVVPAAALYFLVLWLIMYFAEISIATHWGQWVMDRINGSEYLFFLYERNLVKEYLQQIRMV